MNWLRPIRAPSLACGVAVALCVGFQDARAGPIAADTWYQFSFTDVGLNAAGCDPADPGGAFCFSSSGTPTQFADVPAWTFTAPSSGSTLTVVDAFSNGDRFEVFDNGLSLGLTSAPGQASDCGDDPVPCLADAAMSNGSFNLGAGAHSITIVAALSPDGLGSAYFFVDAATVNVLEPGSLALFGAGAVVFGLARRRYPRTGG